MIWAGITARHKIDVVFVDGRLKGMRYRDEILTGHIVPFIRSHCGSFNRIMLDPTSLECVLTMIVFGWTLRGLTNGFL